MESTKKIPFISNCVKSIKDFEYYKSVKNEETSSTIKYFIFIIIIYSIISMIGVVYIFYDTLNTVKNFINNEIKELTYSNGILSINNDEQKSMLNGKVIIDTSKTDNFEYNSYGMIFFGKEYCNVKMENNNFRIRYNDYFYEDINKDELFKIISGIGIKYYVVIAIISLFFEIIILSISTLIDILIIALIGFIMSKLIRSDELNFAEIFKIAVHSTTLPIILAMVYYIINIFLGFYIKYFSVMYTSIAIVYMMTAIILNSMNNTKDIDMQK